MNEKKIREFLVARFPNCFAPRGQGPKRPLKLGIARDLKVGARELSLYDVRQFLRDYCQGRRYLESLVAGAERVDLDGKPAGTVSQEEAAHAVAKLRAQKRNNERNAAIRRLLEACHKIRPGTINATAIPDEVISLSVRADALREFMAALDKARQVAT